MESAIRNGYTVDAEKFSNLMRIGLILRHKKMRSLLLVTMTMLTLTSACSSLPTGTKSLVMLPMCIMQAVFLNTSYFIWLENPERRKENC